MASLLNPEEDRQTRTSLDIERIQDSAQARWEASMSRQINSLHQALQAEPPDALARRCGGEAVRNGIRLAYWNSPVEITWPAITAANPDTGQECSLFDTMLLIYYLRSADGAPLADHWVSFRELPGGAFYHQAFQGYSGDRIARVFASQPDAFQRAAQALHGVHLAGLSEFAYAFQPLPRLRLAALFWPGDDEFPSRGAILFDAASLHYMVLDGLAVLGARLAGKLEKLKDNGSAG